MDLFNMKTYPISIDNRNRLWELASLYQQINIDYNKNDPVKMINMKGKLSRFKFRIGRNGIPDPKKCITYIEIKLFEYM